MEGSLGKASGEFSVDQEARGSLLPDGPADGIGDDGIGEARLGQGNQVQKSVLPDLTIRGFGYRGSGTVRVVKPAEDTEVDFEELHVVGEG
jgi:hypothetical protein